MGTDRYPHLTTRQQLIEWLGGSPSAAAIVVDSYTARVIAEHRDTEQGCCHCGIPGKHYTSDHKAEQPKRCPSIAPSASASRCALDEDHAGILHTSDDAEMWD